MTDAVVRACVRAHVRAHVCVSTQLKERAQLDTERTERTVMHERAALEREQRLLQVEEQVSTPLQHAARQHDGQGLVGLAPAVR